MPKPAWLKTNERARAFKHCINCKHKGDPCGLTNNLGNGRGRVQMFQCKKHPTIKFYCDTLACETYEE